MPMPSSRLHAVDREGTVPGYVRPVIYGFLALFLVTGLFEVQAWPLPGWKLFSHVRTVDDVTIQAVETGTTGGTDTLNGREKAALRNLTVVATHYRDLSAEALSRICRSWILSLAAQTGPVASVRVDRVDQQLVPRDHGRPSLHGTWSTLFTCRASSRPALSGPPT
jgi:hypothetical protein